MIRIEYRGNIYYTHPTDAIIHMVGGDYTEMFDHFYYIFDHELGRSVVCRTSVTFLFTLDLM